jgi:hypothetical protein
MPVTYTIQDDDTPYKRMVEQDEADVPNAVAGGQNLFIDEADGLLKRKDSSGTVTIIENLSVGTGYDEGTSFPGTPALDDKFYRTDRNILYYYDGTRWLSVTLYTQNLMSVGGVAATAGYYSAVWTADYDIYVVDLIATMFAASALSGTAYWRIDLFFWDGATQGSAIATVNNQSETNATFTRKKASINALMGTAKDAIGCVLEKVLSPGNFSGGAFLTYRLVG